MPKIEPYFEQKAGLATLAHLYQLATVKDDRTLTK